MRHSVLVCLLALTLAATAHARPGSLDLQELASRQQQIQADVQAVGGKYRNLDATRRADVLDRSARLLQTIEGKQSSAELTEAERTQVADTVAWIDQALDGGAHEERMVCTFEKATGSNRKVRTCRKASDIERERVEAQKMLARPSVCTAGSPGCI